MKNERKEEEDNPDTDKYILYLSFKMTTGITGIAAVLNLIKGNYPFIESILSVLPICKQMLISDGGSTDGTLEVLQRLKAKYDKIKIFRERWEVHEKGRLFKGVVKTVNRLMRKAKTSHILYLQVDEFITKIAWAKLLVYQKYIQAKCSSSFLSCTSTLLNLTGNTSSKDHFIRCLACLIAGQSE